MLIFLSQILTLVTSPILFLRAWGMNEGFFVVVQEASTKDCDFFEQQYELDNH